MSKIARLASIVERAEKEALVLFIDESKQNDSTALAMLSKRGVPEPDEVLELLKEITVDGTENGKTVWDISKTGKEIQPLAGWFCSTWNNDDLVQARERVADTVHKMYQIPSARNADLTKVWLANKELTDYEEWVKKTYEQDKAKGLIADAEEGEKVNVGAYEFPKKMLAYSDKYVDCYRADNPADAMLLGDGYPFCISRRDGSNMFYTYRMNPTTTAYFCWFKDAQGNKTKKNMVVVHVGEDGKYMVTKSENGNFPRDSKELTIKKYPKLKGAINSGKLVVKPATDTESSIRDKYNFKSKITIDDVEGKTPEYIELILAQGVQLSDEVFDYIFKNIDNGNLRTGNNGNSLIKKYVESGIHRLTKYQKDVLIKAGYENELWRALEVYIRSHLAVGEPLKVTDLKNVIVHIDKFDIANKDSLFRDYVTKKIYLTAEQESCLDKLCKSNPKFKKDYEDLLKGFLIPKRIEKLFRWNNVKVVPVEGGYDVISASTTISMDADAKDFDNIIITIKKIRSVKEIIISNYSREKIDRIKYFPSIPSDVWLYLQNSSINVLRYIKSRIENLNIEGALVGGDIDAMQNVECKRISVNSALTPGTKLPRIVEDIYVHPNVTNKCLDISTLPRKVKNVCILTRGSLLHSDLQGIPDEIDDLTVSYSDDIKYFPKRVGIWHIDFAYGEGEVPQCVKDSDINKLEVSNVAFRSIPGSSFVTWVSERVGKLPIESFVKSFDYTKVIYSKSAKGIELQASHSGLIDFPYIPSKEPLSRLVCDGDIRIAGIFNLSDLPREIVSFSNTNVDRKLYIEKTWLETLSLNHPVEGVSVLMIQNVHNLKHINGLENFRGLKKIYVTDPSYYSDRRESHFRSISDDLLASTPKNVYINVNNDVIQYGDNNESLSLSPLSVALNSIMD